MLSDTIIITGIVLTTILVVPLLCKKIHIPAIAGLILTGLIIGPHGLGLLDRDGIIDSLSQIGILYVMFLSGIEIDINDFREYKGRSVLFGILTFFIPFIATFAIGLLLQFNAWTSLLMASMLASHTLMTYPIVSKYNLQGNQAVSIVIGATILAITGSLLILAFVSCYFSGPEGKFVWLRMLVGGIFMCTVIFGIMPRLARWFLQKFTDTIVGWSFVMTLAVCGGLLAKLAGIEPILGVFLTALAINKQVPNSSSLMTRINFVGNAIFIPIFLLGVGMLIDLSVLTESWQAAIVAIALLAIGVPSKWIAAWLIQRIYKLSKLQRQLIFGLTNSHAAGALATVMIGYGIILSDGSHLIPESVLDGTILLILGACTLSSFITEHAAKHLAIESTPADSSVDDDLLWLLPAQKNVTNRRPKDLASLMLEGVQNMPVEQRVKHIVTGFSDTENDAAFSMLSWPKQSLWMCQLQQPIGEYNRIRVLTPIAADKESYYVGWQLLLEKIVGGLHAEVTQEEISDWSTLPRVARGLSKDELLIVVQSRPGTLSYTESMSNVPEMLRQGFRKHSFVLLYPAQQINMTEHISLLSEPTDTPSSDFSFIQRLKARWIK